MNEEDYYGIFGDWLICCSKTPISDEWFSLFFGLDLQMTHDLVLTLWSGYDLWRPLPASG
ncbi:hypothetical protein AFE_3228 [Acidithiobacillus ferrooxidans ATCC 23270]|uniref:Uncharacterized protein n=2 Tax=root TaxID=1 RepID=B7JBA8_ACIF2|nr:hypothetical protein AFE_3228 [Acidithiobacillus ferrooxidans ATCC 23270]